MDTERKEKGMDARTMKPAGLLLRPNEAWVYEENGTEHGPFVGVTEAVGKAWRLGLVATRLPVRREV